MRRERRRRPCKPIPGSVNHFPTQPGWWVQWCGRTDWQPMDEGSALILQRTITASGDKVLKIDGESSHTFDPKLAAKREKLLRGVEGMQ